MLIQLTGLVTCGLLLHPTPILCEELSLAHLRLSALEMSPEYHDIQASYARQLAEGAAIGLLQNPEVEVTSAIPQGNDQLDSEIEVEIRQPLRVSDFGIRAQVQTAMNHIAGADKKERLLKLSQEVTQLFFSIWSLEQTKNSLRTSLNDVKTAIQTLSKGLEDGSALPSEKILFEGHTAKIEADLLGLEAEQLTLQSSLRRLTQIDTRKAVLKAPEFPDLPNEEEFLKLISENPLGARKRSELFAALRGSQLNLALSEITPTFMPKIGYMKNTDGNDFFKVGIEIPLPLWNTNSHETQAARADKTAAHSLHDYLNSPMYEQSLTEKLQRVRLIEKKRAAYATRVIPSFREVASLELKRLQSGQGSVLSLWEAGRQLSDARIQWIELTREALLSRLELEVLTGQPHAF